MFAQFPPAKRLFRPLLVMIAVLPFGSCGEGSQLHRLIVKIRSHQPAIEAVSEARMGGAAPSAYLQILHQEELAYAEYELSEMNDYTDALFHAKNALRALRGQDDPPQAVEERNLPETTRPGLTAARERLMGVLEFHRQDEKPLAAAKARAAYHCWLEQQEEDLSSADIDACRDRFNEAMAQLDEPVLVTPVEDRPKPTEQLRQPTYTLAADGVFGFDDDEIRPAMASRLQRIAKHIMETPDVDVEILGHTDSIGADVYNFELSRRRAEAVAEYLSNLGVERRRLLTSGMGASMPIAPNETREGRALNRRAEIYLP